jgi:hypothetical protein
MPSIASHLGITIPREQLMEIDGVDLTGKLCATGLAVSRNQQKLTLTWKAVDKGARGKIWLSYTNNFKTGGRDKYELMKEIDLKEEKAEITVNNPETASFLKIVLETPGNFLNYWINLK